jgi:hypothetical protein
MFTQALALNTAPGYNKTYHTKNENPKDIVHVTKIQRAIREHTYPKRTGFYCVPTTTRTPTINKITVHQENRSLYKIQD